MKIRRGSLHEVKNFLHYYYGENRGYAKNRKPVQGGPESSLLHIRADNLGANGPAMRNVGAAKRSGAVKICKSILPEVKIYLHKLAGIGKPVLLEDGKVRNGREMAKLAVHLILPNPDQPRSNFDAEELRCLAQSIRERGLIQPLVVERAAGKRFILVDGERRLRAVKLLGWMKVEVVVRRGVNHAGRGRLVDALVANIQREDLGPIDEAKAYAALHHQLGSVRAVSEKLGVHDELITNRLKMLKLTGSVQAMFQAKQLPLDGQLIQRLTELRPAEQERAAATGVARGWTTYALRKAAVKRPGKSKPSAVEVQPQRTLRKLAEEEADAKLAGHFDALVLVADWQRLPKPIVEVARKSCQACILYKEARRAMCERCPLPDFLVRFKLQYVQAESK